MDNMDFFFNNLEKLSIKIVEKIFLDLFHNFLKFKNFYRHFKILLH